jgi:hypothetical protein
VTTNNEKETGMATGTSDVIVDHFDGLTYRFTVQHREEPYNHDLSRQILKAVAAIQDAEQQLIDD